MTNKFSGQTNTSKPHRRKFCIDILDNFIYFGSRWEHRRSMLRSWGSVSGVQTLTERNLVGAVCAVSGRAVMRAFNTTGRCSLPLAYLFGMLHAKCYSRCVWFLRFSIIRYTIWQRNLMLIHLLLNLFLLSLVAEQWSYVPQFLHRFM